ncbi:unnamed protein product [Mytilus edulis]|uniref:DNA-directed DNA polymerase n=1 Tax=Mytilus edulis TaxID=6550 RepID=A0A8S3UJR0_MYTED|nr:unnamed protein product [Mytilus edulis]
MIFFDCETTQDTLLQCENGNLPSTSRCQNCKDKEEACNQCTLCQNCGKSWCGSKEHKVNFICMQTACDHCKDKQISDEPKCNFCGVRCSMCDKKDKKEFKKEPCFKTCGFRERIFRGEHATDAFCRRVFTEQYTNAVVLSHNGSGYDNYFLIDWLIKNSIRPDVIFNGSKIMYMAINRGLNIRVLDSLNFLPMKLSKIPKAFGLKELKKGYFPHFFNTMENQNYIGPYPDSTYYGCDYMSKDDRSDFLSWYKTKTNEVFDFAKEMKEYCCSDTTILREGVLRFRDLMLEVTGTGKTKNTHGQGVDVLDYVTIASVCMGVYKTNFLKEQYDVEVLRQDTDDIDQIPMTFTEKGFDVLDHDTWKSSETFLSENPQSKFGQRKFVKSPLAHVPSEGYTKRYNHSKSSIVWLEWMMKEEKMSIQHALNRGEFKIPGTKFHVDGYCQETNEVFEFLGGGRTDTTKLYHKVENEDKIKYVDFTSLYPWTNKYCRYPLHHPEIITKDFEELDTYFGLCKVKILPPRHLYHAVLPYRCHGKLTFPLCRTCADTKHQGKCTHNEQERSITGTYATPEVMVAKEKDYVQLFLKIKQEASGFPPHCQTEEEKRDYIRLYKENEGIDLDYDSIKIISDPTKVVENFHIVSNDTIQLEWTQNSKFPPVDAKTNIFIAIFTTMWARLKLYEVLDMLDDRVLYTDTDSCIYVSQKGKPEPSLGNYLGELTSEIPADEGHIVEFVSGGPKNYAYRTLKTETCKVKGFTLNFTNSNIVNFNAVKGDDHIGQGHVQNVN